MSSGSIARRYARAILAVAEGEGELEKTGEELLALASVAAAPEVAALLANPLVAESKRRDLVTAIAC